MSVMLIQSLSLWKVEKYWSIFNAEFLCDELDLAPAELGNFVVIIVLMGFVLVYWHFFTV